MKQFIPFTARSRLGIAAGVAVAVAASAEPHPPPRLKPPSTDVMILPPPRSIHVPVKGSVDPANTLVSAVVSHSSDRPPTEPIERAALPELHAKARRGGAVTPGYQCANPAKTECYFTKMPLYSQINPNLAYVSVPEETYQREGKPVTGPMVWDAQTNGWAVVLNSGTPNEKLDPYYTSWLPLGPDPKDPGTIGIFHTMLCGPTSESMALMAAIEARSPTTKIRPGSWTDVSFLRATRPAWQQPLPSPLKDDRSTAAPDGQQMTAVEVQRVINMAILQKTDPIGGGSDGEFVSNPLDQEFFSTKKTTRPIVDVKLGQYPTTDAVIEVLADRYAPVIVEGYYHVTLSPTKNAAGKITKWSMTLERKGGHFMAVNGFKGKGTPGAQLLIFNPVFAAMQWKTIYSLPMMGAKTKDGVPIEAFRKTKTGNEPVAAANWTFLQGKTPVATLADLPDQGEINIVEGYRAIRID